ncbi:Meiotic recombination protein REC8 -like protein [Triplophysa tibetana]|uniref:Meiotic recombination protein REC8-like protein n=1 Tax=Triplophysa tibetana TaxID=1572043 RepID=A0A5A9PA87_9TELE|nr:Meiotic recombination protein REC8 -like protein [Triplophysa tibetana]
MFDEPDILPDKIPTDVQQRRQERLAATKGRKISRRDLLKVNVQSTCCDILDYVLVRVPPPAAGLPRPRFSLYLSSQLQYGVVLVYHRQCDFLLEDTQGAIDKLHRLSQKPNIDLMDQDTRQSYMIPDALALLDETEWARDPFFGVMDTEYGLPSPSSLIQMAQRMEEAFPERASLTREPTPPSDGITASQESITLTEREPVTLPEPEFEGEELQESGIIDLLLEQPDYFPEAEQFGEEERQQETERQGEQIENEPEEVREPEVPEERMQIEIEAEAEAEEVREPEVPEEREQERAVLEREITPSVSLDLEQITGVSSRDVVLLPEEDLGLPMEMPVLEEREKTPEPVLLPIPSPPLGVEEENGIEPRRDEGLAAVSPEYPEVQRKRRRQLLFIDKDTQISQEEMRAQINDAETETRALADVLVKLPVKQTDPKKLLGNPCMSLPPEILALWKQAAVTKPILPSRRHWSVPEAEIPEREEQRDEPREVEQERELSSKEIPREMVESGLFQQETPASSGVLETTDRDFSPIETPEIRRSPAPPVPYTLEDIPEERIPEMEQITMDIDETRPLAPSEASVTFHSLLPPQASRRVVAQHFWRLLERTVAKQVTVQQDESYGDIIISQIQPLID